jgi:hypothetical protein
MKKDRGSTPRSFSSVLFRCSEGSRSARRFRNRFPRRREGNYETEYIPRRVEREMISRRSSSERPPQIPYGSCTASACARHSAITGQELQTALAAISRALRRGPRSFSGWKNISVGRVRHAPCCCHSHDAATGFGSLDTSVMLSSFPISLVSGCSD